MSQQPVTRIRAKNFRSLADVDVAIAPFTVLVGPNGSGKTNLLNILRFLAATVRFDLGAALREWRGFESVQRQARETGAVKLTVEGAVTQYASESAPDAYTLTLQLRGTSLSRTEEFTFKRRGGRGRRITVTGSTVRIADEGGEDARRQLAGSQTTGLATLPKLADEDGGLGIRSFTDFLTRLRVFEPDVQAARQPARPYGATLADDASNLADALERLRRQDEDAWELLKIDMSQCLPGFQDLNLAPVGGSTRAVAVQIVESGLRKPIDLADASFGTVRLLALLTALHEPDPPPLLAIEEVDHGLHPYAIDVLVDRLRAAASRTQVLAATHSPTLVNRLEPGEIVVCDRDPMTGASLIPAISSERITAAVRETDWRPGELWFSGALRGVPA